MDALPPEPPPQWLPVGARWCVAPQRCIDLEVARSSEQQRLGLMQRPALPPLRGMWFPFSTPQPQQFWMFNTLAPLDMIFVRDGRVLDLVRAVPADTGSGDFKHRGTFVPDAAAHPAGHVGDDDAIGQRRHASVG